RRRFVETMRMRGFALHLDRINATAIEEWRARASLAGVRIEPVTAKRLTDQTFWNQMCQLHRAAQEGWPDPDPGGVRPPIAENDLRTLALSGGQLPLALFVAREGDALVGYSAL